MESRLKGIINNLSQVTVILNQAGEIIYTTDHIKKILGYDSEELIGKSSLDLLIINNHSKAKLQYEAFVIQENLVVNSVLRMKHKEGRIIWTELTATNLLHDQYIKGVLITARNISDQKKWEEQRMAQAITEVQEKERHTLAAELHDNINQMIVASVYLIDSAMKDTEQREMLLAESSKILKDAVNEIRKLSSSLVSYDLEDFGLVRSVRNFVRTISLSNRFRIVIKMNDSIEPLLAVEQKLHLYRIIQEQVNNILKHAKASRVLISFSKSCNSLQLKIKDNGVGFDVNSSRNGIGISNIIQRVKALNGLFHIVSEKNGGTSVIIRFILNEESLQEGKIQTW